MKDIMDLNSMVSVIRVNTGPSILKLWIIIRTFHLFPLIHFLFMFLLKTADSFLH